MVPRESTPWQVHSLFHSKEQELLGDSAAGRTVTLKGMVAKPSLQTLKTPPVMLPELPEP